MTKVTHPPVVYVAWMDAAQLNGGWEDREQVVKAAERYYRPICASGFLLQDGPKYVVLAAANVASATAECVEAPAEPKAIGLEAWVTDTGKVKVAWDGCARDGFWAYKVVRSQVNEWPTYPIKDGDQLIAAIGDPSVTTFKDGDVAAGQTWTYRVLALGDGGALLCASPARTVTVE